MLSRLMVYLTTCFALTGGPSVSVALRRRGADQDIVADWGERFQLRVSATLYRPILGPLHRRGGDGCFVGNDPDDVGAPLDLDVQALKRVCVL